MAGRVGRQFPRGLAGTPDAEEAPAIDGGSPPTHDQGPRDGGRGGGGISGRVAPEGVLPPMGVGAAGYGAPQAAIAEAKEPVVVDGFGVPMSWATGMVVVEFDADANATWFRLLATEPTGDGSPDRPGGLQSRGGKLGKGKPKGFSSRAAPALPADVLEF